MHYAIRIYSIDPKNGEEILRQAESGFVPLISSQPGFVSYRAGVADNGRVISVTVFEDRAGAEASSGKAAQWVRETIAGLAPNPPEVISGEARMRKMNPQEPLNYGVMRRYTVEPKNIDEIVRRVESGLVPIVSGLPGFAAYVGLDAGNGVLASLSGFRDRAAAEESTTRATAWVRDNLGPLMPNPPQVTTMEIRFAKVK